MDTAKAYIAAWIPAYLKEWLEEKARDDERSMTKELTVVLRGAYELDQHAQREATNGAKH